MSGSFDTSTLTKVASPPAALTWRTVSLPSSTRRPATTTSAPSRANASAVARPMPLVPPVINATLFANGFMGSPSNTRAVGLGSGRAVPTLRLNVCDDIFRRVADLGQLGVAVVLVAVADRDERQRVVALVAE